MFCVVIYCIVHEISMIKSNSCNEILLIAFKFMMKIACLVGFNGPFNLLWWHGSETEARCGDYTTLTREARQVLYLLKVGHIIRRYLVSQH